MKRSVLVGVVIASLVAATVLVWMEVRREREFRRLIAAGDAAGAQDQTNVAIEAFSGALVLKRDSMLAHLKRGDTYRQRGELSASLRDLEEAATLDPTAPRPVELLGDVNATMGRHLRAAQYYQEYLILDDRAPRVLYKLALARYRSGQAAHAIDPLRKALALDDRFAEAHYLLGVCLRDRNRRPEALRALNRAIAINAGLSAAREELADLYAQLGRGRDRIEQLEALAALEPGRAERLVSVGLAYARLGRPDSAVVTLGRAAERFPGHPAVHAALARIWLEISEAGSDAVTRGKAVEVLQPTALRPDATSEILALYGRALLLSGNAAAAERTLQQAVARLPVEPLAFRYLAEAARRLGHAAIARDAERRYAALTRT